MTKLYSRREMLRRTGRRSGGGHKSILRSSYGTRSFAELVQPAIGFCREGVPIDAFFARSIRGASGNFRKDPGSVKLWLVDGEPHKES